MKKKYSVIWAGSDEAFEIYAGAAEAGAQLDAAMYSDSASQDMGILDVQNGVGVIQIKGTLTDKDAWYNSLLGLVSYNEIQEALYRAVADPAVKEILLDIGSPGGTVYGLTDTVDAVSKAAAAKPVTAFSDSVMASAAMWLAAPAQKRYVGPLATIGSIGVVAKHVEFSKMRAEEGVTETIIRSGEYKQLANSAEPLTPKAEATLQESADHAYGVFVKDMAKHLGKSYEVVDSTMAQGRDFMGSKAVDVGLATAVSTFDDIFAGMQIRISKNNGGSDMKKKYALSEAAAIAAAASGAELELKADDGTELEAGGEAGVSPEDGAEDIQSLKRGDDGKLEANAGDADAGDADADAGATGDADGEAGELEANADAGEAAQEPSAAEVLLGQIKSKEEEIFQLKTDLSAATKDSEALSGLMDIAAKSINNMNIAMGGTEADLSDVSASDLVLQHTVAATRFASEFKIGGVAATAATDDVEPAQKKASITRLDARKAKMVVKR